MTEDLYSPRKLLEAVRIAREEFGPYVRVEEVDLRRREARVVLFESFEVTFEIDGGPQRAFLWAVWLAPGRNVSATLREHPMFVTSADDVRDVLRDVREWCVRVLPEDFLAELEAGLGVLPGVSGGGR